MIIFLNLFKNIDRVYSTQKLQCHKFAAVCSKMKSAFYEALVQRQFSGEVGNSSTSTRQAVFCYLWLRRLILRSVLRKNKTNWDFPICPLFWPQNKPKNGHSAFLWQYFELNRLLRSMTQKTQLEECFKEK